MALKPANPFYAEVFLKAETYSPLPAFLLRIVPVTVVYVCGDSAVIIEGKL